MQKGCTQRVSTHGRETFLEVADIDDETRRVGLTAHRSERSKSESMICPSSRTRMFSGFKSR